MLYHVPVNQISLPYPPVPLLAIDLETELFEEPTYDFAKKTRHTPFKYPTPIVASLCDLDSGLRVIPFSDLHAALGAFLSTYPDGHIVFHNAPFDVGVITAHGNPALASLIIGLGEQFRLHDTLVFEQLIEIACGSRTIDARSHLSLGLAEITKRRTGVTLVKDPSIRLNFHTLNSLTHEEQQPFLGYAAQDAFATFSVYCSQYREALVLANAFSDKPDASAVLLPYASGKNPRFGLLTEPLQVQGSLALSWMEGFPLRVDLRELETIRTRLCNEALALEEVLISFGFARRAPRTQRFSLLQKHLRSVLLTYARNTSISYPSSSTGLLSLTYDFWARALPRPPASLIADPSSAKSIDERLLVWLRYCRLRKLISTYLNVYCTSPTHYSSYRSLGARTGRTSSHRPNIQQIPKHRDGIRSLFIPSPDHVFLEADYKAAELVALAQTYHNLYGGSLLGDAINQGKDPHIETARRLYPGDWEALPDSEKKRYRQMAKSVNFGLCGGLGAAKFQTYANRSYGLSLSLEEARALRNKALEADPQLRQYLSDSQSIPERIALAAANLNLSTNDLISRFKSWQIEDASDTPQPHWRLLWSRLRKWANGDTRFQIDTPPGFDPRFDLFRKDAASPCGFIRGRCSFTEAHNLPFQSLVACGAKLAAYRLMRLYRASPFFTPVAFIHDSFLVECQPPAVPVVRELLQDAMISGMQSVCPDIKVAVDVSEPLTRWGVATTGVGAPVQTI